MKSQIHPGTRIAALNPLALIFGLIIILSFLVLYIYITQFIYKDAVKRNLNAELWILIVFLVPIISWIVYFLVRNVKPTRPNPTLKDSKK